MNIDGDDPRSFVGILRVHADYDLPGGLGFAHAAIQAFPRSLPVIEAAADVIAQEGQQDEAVRILDEAWEQSPDNAVLRRIRLQWGLPTDLPEPPPDEAPPEDTGAP